MVASKKWKETKNPFKKNLYNIYKEGIRISKSALRTSSVETNDPNLEIKKD